MTRDADTTPAPTVVSVSGCTSCPFVYAYDNGGGWRCAVCVYWPNRLDGMDITAYAVGSPWPDYRAPHGGAPPDCPLRDRPLLIVLGAGTETADDDSAPGATDLRGVTWMGRPVSDLRVEFSAGDLSPPFRMLSSVEKTLALSALRLSALRTEHGSCSWARDPGSSGYGITATELDDGSMRLTLRFCPDFETRLSQLRAEFDPDRSGKLTDGTP